MPHKLLTQAKGKHSGQDPSSEPHRALGAPGTRGRNQEGPLVVETERCKQNMGLV